MDWRDPNSTDEKRRLTEEHYGDTVPGYLLFHLGDITRLTDEEEKYLNDLFFEGHQPSFGDKELHNGHGYTGSYLHHAPGQKTLVPFVVLRIRGAQEMHYAITLRGEERPLLQVTNGDNTKPILNFMERWGLSSQDTRVTNRNASRLQVPADPFGAQTAFIQGEFLVAVEVDSSSEPPRREPYEALSAVAMTAPPPKKTPFNRFLDWLFG